MMNLLYVTVLTLCCLSLATLNQAGFLSFYLPNALKPRGYNELTDMIEKIKSQINETKDHYADAKYFWGLLKKVDLSTDAESSACYELFPMFRDMAMEYADIDYEYYMKPFEEFKEHLLEFRALYYTRGLESKAALPREWEQNLLQFELESRIKWLDLLANNGELRQKRQKMIDVWKKVRRNLDHSLACIYLRYAYRQIAEDISQIALDANLDGMKEAEKVLLAAYKRIAKFKDSDEKIIADIMDERLMETRFKIKV